MTTTTTTTAVHYEAGRDYAGRFTMRWSAAGREATLTRLYSMHFDRNNLGSRTWMTDMDGTVQYWDTRVAALGAIRAYMPEA